MIKRIGVIRVLSGKDQAFLDMHQNIMDGIAINKQWQTRSIWDQPEGIHDPETFQLALPKIVQLGQEWQHELDLLVVSCAADPGVTELKATLSIPVYGAGESCCWAAREVGDCIGILGIEPEEPDVFKRELADCTTIYRRPHNVHCTHDIMTADGQQAIIDAALECQALGAKVIALACTGMATVDIASVLAPHLALPVINPVIALAERIARV
ncbi:MULTISPECIES: aspartate/glutamate racemase family protein [Vibrio]|uniref:Hydantoin racemase n=2 Tax=Vibrio TaxID=662 RepID=A0A7X4LJW0_9VIBR|nr:MULTISPECIES: aspartate/glutamate racemase family protein [Vibrio]MBF9002813.1 hydantoin racemase [Vibrio nitrifigilis]MZI92967.1 hydantoin racemase [Vibrio eleionomae]